MSSNKILTIFITVLAIVIIGEFYYLFFVKSTGITTSKTQPSSSPSPSPLSRVKPPSEELNLEDIKLSIRNAKYGLYESASLSYVIKGKIIQIIDNPQETIKARRAEWRNPVFSFVVETDWDTWEKDPGVKQKVVLLYNEDDLRKTEITQEKDGKLVQLSYTDLKVDDTVEIEETKDLINEWDTNTKKITIKRIL